MTGLSDAKAQVLAATDLVQLISKTVALKRRGKEWVGLCPFHQEKTPSFNVSSEKQLFICRGCKAGGNAIDFVMKRDRLEFLDALKLLAEEAGIELPRYGGNDARPGERMQLLDAQNAAAKFFKRILLLDSRGKPAREYLRTRGFSEATLDEFRVGFAPDAWDALRDSPEMKPFPASLLQQAGLLKAREQGGGFYDTFRDRVMFPIRDESGKTIAFGGRVMPGGDSPAKYLNSPETPLFSKSRTAFGLDLARQRIVETRTAVVVEGYTDVMMAHQYDVRNVVSVLGTALTEQHVGLLKRFADRIVLLFDADAAGKGAADRSLELFLTQPIEIAIATLPEGKDPDEVLIEQGKAGFEAVIATAQPALEYLWDRLYRQYVEHAEDLTGQAKTIDEYLARLASVNPATTDAMRLNAAMVRASKLTGIPVEELMSRVRSLRKSQQPQHPNTPRTPAAARPVARRKSGRETVEQWLIGAVLVEPDRWNDVQKQVEFKDITTAQLRRLAEAMWDLYRNEGTVPLNEFVDLLPSDLKSLAIESAHEAQQKDLAQRQKKDRSSGSQPSLIENCLTYLSDERRREELTANKALIASSDDEDEITAALRRVQEQAKQADLKRS